MDFLEKAKGMIFDLDNTLLDSHSAWHDVDAEFFRRRKIEMPDDYGRKVATMSFVEAAIYSINEFGLDETVEDLTSEWFSAIENKYATELKIFEGVSEYLQKLKNQGKKIALATASSRKLYAPALKNNGIYDYFDAFVSTDEVKRGKGFPDVYLLAAKRAGLAARDCVVFEDIAPGIKAAKSVQMKAVAFLNPNASREWEVLRQEADGFFDTYFALL